MEFILLSIGIGAVTIGGVIGWYRFRAVINICGEMLAKDYQDGLKKPKMLLAQKAALEGHYQGAYWCEGCSTWQLPVGHEKHIESCGCNY